MQSPTLLGALVVLLALAGAGCHKEEAKQQGKQGGPEATAWWKTEGQGGGPTAAAKLTGESLPGWKKYAGNTALAAQGSDVFSKNCASCHTFGKGATAGPDLQGVTHRNTPEWTAKFISAPETMVNSDPHAKELISKYLVQMPNMHLKPDQVDAVNAYFYQQDQAAVHGK